MKVFAAITEGKSTFTLDEIELGSPQKGEVLVDIKAAGVCHTDYDSMSWGKTMIMGHEGAGVVHSVGEGVDEFKAGDRVILNWAIPCGTCFQCSQENQNICETNSFVTAKDTHRGQAHAEGTTWQGNSIDHSFNLGTMASSTLVKEEALIKIDCEIPFSSAATIGCGVMTGYGSVLNAAKVESGSSVVVLGTGGVGLNVIQGAKISGAKKIIAVDRKSERLEMAKTFGATHVIQPHGNDPELLGVAEKVKELTEGRGSDYAFECTAVPELGAAPLAMVRNAGTAVQVSGIEQKVNIDMELFEWDKIYINPLYGQCQPKVHIPQILSHYEKGELKLDEMVTQLYPLDKLDQAFEDMHKGVNAKGVIVF